jgi:hypothetical protein
MSIEKLFDEAITIFEAPKGSHIGEDIRINVFFGRKNQSLDYLFHG